MAAKKDNEGRLSIRAYARRCGTTHVTVGKAITAGGIVEGYDEESGKILVEIADREWGSFFMEKNFFTPADSLTEKQKRALDAKAAEEEEKKSEVNRSFVPGGFQFSEKARGKRGSQDDDEEGGAGWTALWNGGEIPSNAPYQEAIRIETIEKARMKQLQREELEGLLVRKRDVDKQLEVAGIEIRKMVERIPAMCVDDILASKGRTEAIIIMEDKMAELLNSIGDVIVRMLSIEEEIITEIPDNDN